MTTAIDPAKTAPHAYINRLQALLIAIAGYDIHMIALLSLIVAGVLS